MCRAEAKAYLESTEVLIREAGVETGMALLEGHPPQRIIDYIHDQAVDLVVLSTHGKGGLSGWNISSVVHKLISRSRSSTLTVRAYQPTTDDLANWRYRRLLLPLDGSQRAECALPPASTLARLHGAQIILAHAVCEPEMPRRGPPTPEDLDLASRVVKRNRVAASRYLDQLQSRMDLDVRTRLLVPGDGAGTLHDLLEEENVDLVVMCAHGYTGGSKWPHGSVTASFIEYSTAPLLIVRDLPQDPEQLTEAEEASRERKGH
jgi:nucleotide-binding universal stress UspA family protein